MRKRILFYMCGVIATMAIGICTGFFIINATGSWDVPVSGSFEVSIPATITVANASSDITYNVSASGELHPYDKVIIKPDSSSVVFTKVSDNSDTRTVNISQETTKLKVCNDTTGVDTTALSKQTFDIDAEGTISLSDANLTAGAWTAQLNFTIGYQNNSQADYFSGFNAETGESGHYNTLQATEDGVTTVVIPSEINDVTVTKLNSFFTSPTEIDSVYMPDTITELSENCFTDVTAEYIRLSDNITIIPTSCFSNCTNLLSIVIPENVTRICGYAFSYCSSLSSINLPESITDLEFYAFTDVTGLTQLDIPASVINFGVNSDNTIFGTNPVIKNCPNLQTVHFKGDLSYGNQGIANCSQITSVIFDGFVDKSPKTTSSRFFSNCEHPFTAIFNCPDQHKIGSDLFYWSCVNNIISVGDITDIGYYSFYGCTQLNTLDLSKVTQIGGSAFSLSSITEANLPELTTLKAEAFSLCRNLTTLSIPKITTIPERAFAYCKKLSQINILLNKLTYIGNYAFIGCCDLAFSGNVNTKNSINDTQADLWLTLPNTLTYLGEAAFNGCLISGFTIPSSLSSYSTDSYGILYNADKTKIECYPAGKSVAEIPDFSALTTIGEAAFYYVYNLYDVNGEAIALSFPNVATVEDMAFRNCYVERVNLPLAKSLGSLAFSESNIVSAKFPTATSLGSSIFYCCINLEEIVLDSITAIDGERWATSSSVHLTKLEAPTATSGSYTLHYFKKLTKLVYGGNVTKSDLRELNELQELYLLNATTIDSEFLKNHTALEIVHLDKAETISAEAFENIPTLTTIYLPATVTIGEAAFKNCTGLENVLFTNSEGEDEDCKISSIGAYAFASTKLKNINWGSVEEIGNYAFANSSLNSITFSGVQTLGDSAFANCTSLNSADFKNSTATKTGANLFENCSALTEFSFNETGITTVENNTFKNCNALEYLELSNKITTLNDSFISGCINLPCIFVYNSSVNISENAFAGCDNLWVTIDAVATDYTNTQWAYGSCLNGRIIWRDAFSYNVVDNSALPEEYRITEADYADMMFSSLIIDCNEIYPMTYAYESKIGININSNRIDLSDWFHARDNYDSFSMITAWAVDDVTGTSKEPATEFNLAMPAELEGAKVTAIMSDTDAETYDLTKFNDDKLNVLYFPDNIYFMQTSFSDSINLSKIRLPDNPAYFQIDPSFFSGCTSLQSVEFPDSILVIGIQAFANSGLTEIDLNNVNYILLSAFSSTKITSIELPVTCIQSFTQNGETIDGLTDVYPGTGAFSGCTELTSVTFDEDFSEAAIELRNEYYSDNEKGISSLAFIPAFMFANCTNLTHIEIPAGIVGIKSGAFFNTNIDQSNAVIPDTVEFFGLGTFSNTPWDRSGIMISGDYVIGGRCSGTIILPDNIKTISGIIPVNDTFLYVHQNFLNDILLFNKPYNTNEQFLEGEYRIISANSICCPEFEDYFKSVERVAGGSGFLDMYNSGDDDYKLVLNIMLEDIEDVDSFNLLMAQATNIFPDNEYLTNRVYYKYLNRTHSDENFIYIFTENIAPEECLLEYVNTKGPIFGVIFQDITRYNEYYSSVASNAFASISDENVQKTIRVQFTDSPSISIEDDAFAGNFKIEIYISIDSDATDEEFQALKEEILANKDSYAFFANIDDWGVSQENITYVRN